MVFDVKRLLGVAAVVTLTAATLADVDLSPRYKTIDLGGALIQRVHFRDGDKEFAVTINSDIEISGSGKGAIFRFKSIPLADMSLRPSPVSPAIPFSPEKMADYRRIAQEQLGANVEIVEAGEPEMDVLPINNWTSCRLNFTTRQAGVVFKTDVTFLNLSKSQQIMIVTSAKEGVFADVRGRAHKIMSRWHQVLPGDELGLN
jgi:hypothetical protein